MPSFQDSAVIFFIALLLFGPKKLPELARQLGKLMGEFRRASNEFRMQMDEELRVADQEEQRKTIAAIEAAAPAAPLLADYSIAPPTDAGPVEKQYGEDHPHLSPAAETVSAEPLSGVETFPAPAPPDRHTYNGVESAPLPIATSGDLNLMLPSTGLPVSNSALMPVLDAIPHIPDPEVGGGAEAELSEAPQHG